YVAHPTSEAKDLQAQARAKAFGDVLESMQSKSWDGAVTIFKEQFLAKQAHRTSESGTGTDNGRSGDKEVLCAAQHSDTGPNDLQDCDWPFCGCDPKADKVIEAIEESGFKIVKAES